MSSSWLPDGRTDAVRVRFARDATASGLTVEANAPDGLAIVDGASLRVGYRRLDGIHGLIEIDGSPARVLFGALRGRSNDGVLVREVDVNGWRFEVEVESAARAALRDRARRDDDGLVAGGTREIRAVIPGRLVRVVVAPGDAVIIGQPLVVLEAMKMQNEVRATGDGVIERVLVSVGENVEVGDLLVILS
ncbi:MAG: acyl-CoA carboxylase biotin carboxyl carrier protein subunit [Candidatus Limnocylindrales bacterium]